MIGLMVAWTIAFFFANLFQCVPIWENWVNYNSTTDTCIDELSMYLGQAYSDVISDGKLCVESFGSQTDSVGLVIILSLPIPKVGCLQTIEFAPLRRESDMDAPNANKTQSCSEWDLSSRNIVSDNSYALLAHQDMLEY